MQAIFDRDKEFDFDTFYDVSAWNMADAYGLEWMPLASSLPRESLSEPITAQSFVSLPSLSLDRQSVAIAVPGNAVHSLPLAYRLLEQEFRLRLVSGPCQVTDMRGDLVSLDAGSVLIHRADQKRPWDEAVAACEGLVNALQLRAISVQSSLTETGPDLGSDSFREIRLPRVAILVGQGTDVAGAGGLWFALDRLLDIPSSRIEPSQLSETALSRYTCLFIPDGEKQRLAGPALTAIRSWARSGGHLVLVGGAVASLASILSENENESTSKMILGKVDGVILDAQVSGNSFWNKVIGKSRLSVFQNDPLWSIEQPPSCRSAISRWSPAT